MNHNQKQQKPIPPCSSSELTTIQNPSIADLKVIDDGIDEFNGAQPELSWVRPLSVVSKSCDGRVLAGAVGRTWGECCELQQLWVSAEFRGRGIGKKLMREFEQAAWERGCRLIYLYTFTFQAPAFYQKLGYEPALVTRGYTAEIEKFTMHKTLPSQGTEAKRSGDEI